MIGTLARANAHNIAIVLDGNGGRPLGPTTYQGHTLAFDAENRMTAYGSILTAGYRADGLRAWKTTSAGTTYYLYDGDKPVEEVDGSGAKAAVMTFGPNGVLARTTATRTLLYSFDALGQMAQQIDAAAGTIVASYLFDAWGARQVATGDPTAASDPYSGYNTAAGYITDWETGLQLLGHRYYDPATGRFLNRDPIGMAGGVNLYAYCANSPTGTADRSGLSAGGIGGAATGGGLDSAFANCIGSFLDIARMIYRLINETGYDPPPAVCIVISESVACVVNAIAGIVIGAIGKLSLTGPLSFIAGALLGCAVGAAMALANDLLQWLISKSCDPCHKNDPFNTCQAIGDSILGCIIGAIGGFADFLPPDWKELIMENFGTFILGILGWGGQQGVAAKCPS